MKTKIIFLSLVILFLGCKREEFTSPEKTYKNSVWFIDSSDEFPIIGMHKNGTAIAVQTDKNKVPIAALYYDSTDSLRFYLQADINGYPTKAIANDVIILFENYTKNTVDVAFILPDGDIEIVRKVEFTPPPPVNISSLKSVGEYQAFNEIDLVRWGGHALSIGLCVSSLAATGFSLGALSPLAAIGCGAAIVGIATEIVPDDWPLVKGSGTVLSTAGSGISCVFGDDPLNCVAFAATTFGSFSSSFQEVTNTYESEIQLAQGGLISPIPNVPEDINEFFNADFLKILEDKKMPVYDGLNPRNVEGIYFVNSLKNWETDDTYIDYTYKFENEKSNLAIQVKYTDADKTSVSSSTKAYIAGHNDFFSIYANFNSVHDEGTHIVRISATAVVSGIITTNGIKNFMQGFIITSKSNDLNNAYMNVGESRIVYEEDGLAQKVSTYPYVNLKKLLQSKNYLLKK